MGRLTFGSISARCHHVSRSETTTLGGPDTLANTRFRMAASTAQECPGHPHGELDSL